jgi:hypothetical protein
MIDIEHVELFLRTVTEVIGLPLLVIRVCQIEKHLRDLRKHQN